MLPKKHPEIRVNFGCHREERSDVTIPNGIASSSTFAMIEAMPLWIATHSFGMLAMTDQVSSPHFPVAQSLRFITGFATQSDPYLHRRSYRRPRL